MTTDKLSSPELSPPELSSPGLASASRPASSRGLAALAVSVMLFATAWPVMKIALRDATPLWMAAARLWLAAASAFLLLLAFGQLRRPARHDLPMILSVGVLQLAGFFMLSNLALRYVSAGRSVIIAYTTTLWLLPLGVLYLGERLSKRRTLGALAGLAGVVVLFNPLSFDWSDRAALWGNACLLVAALAWALAIFHARCHVWRLSPLQLLPWQMLVAALLVSLLAALFEPTGMIRATPSLLLSLVWLGLLAGPIGTWTAVSASRALPTVVTSLGFLCVPLLGVALSVLWLGEPFGAVLLAGSGLILLGLALVSLG